MSYRSQLNSQWFQNGQPSKLEVWKESSSKYGSPMGHALLKRLFYSLTLISPGYLDAPKPGVGGGGIKTKRFSIYNMANFPPKSTKHGLRWKLTSLPICRVFDHFSMLNSLVVRGRRSSLVWSLAFGTTIFENASFFTYIGNMYIKWKLKTF